MNDYNAITWSKNKFLTWSDFQAESNPASLEDAHSVIKYRYTWIVNSDDVDNQIKFFIDNIKLTAEFYPLLSWIRSSQTNPTLLKHEQGHFDLAEQLRPKITENLQMVFNGKNFLVQGKNQEQQKQFAREYSNLMISKELEKWERYLFEKQEEYDRQTNYGQIVESQLEYDKRFKNLRV